MKKLPQLDEVRAAKYKMANSQHEGKARKNRKERQDYRAFSMRKARKNA